ncbi:hypothetical protein HYH02_013613 [Chlamydomonas schloesseri]|uniref:Uncharacterized protein n=1 Tax=Chlamydomonas schloesseri TaxID=2026947 RepID=A0A835SYX0_9CHLO|nr:hypothetical protein HYH02_013613 [Chlamydomonas schloesseri]|eukprot:KAG2430774.1 hypothetical protein HYH02_013613 [Chlamydomonas schloesseri]
MAIEAGCSGERSIIDLLDAITSADDGAQRAFFAVLPTATKHALRLVSKSMRTFVNSHVYKVRINVDTNTSTWTRTLAGLAGLHERFPRVASLDLTIGADAAGPAALWDALRDLGTSGAFSHVRQLRLTSIGIRRARPKPTQRGGGGGGGGGSGSRHRRRRRRVRCAYDYDDDGYDLYDDDGTDEYITSDESDDYRGGYGYGYSDDYEDEESLFSRSFSLDGFHFDRYGWDTEQGMHVDELPEFVRGPLPLDEAAAGAIVATWTSLSDLEFAGDWELKGATAVYQKLACAGGKDGAAGPPGGALRRLGLPLRLYHDRAIRLLRGLTHLTLSAAGDHDSADFEEPYEPGPDAGSAAASDTEDGGAAAGAAEGGTGDGDGGADEGRAAERQALEEMLADVALEGDEDIQDMLDHPMEYGLTLEEVMVLGAARAEAIMEEALRRGLAGPEAAAGLQGRSMRHAGQLCNREGRRKLAGLARLRALREVTLSGLSRHLLPDARTPREVLEALPQGLETVRVRNRDWKVQSLEPRELPTWSRHGANLTGFSIFGDMLFGGGASGGRGGGSSGLPQQLREELVIDVAGGCVTLGAGGGGGGGTGGKVTSLVELAELVHALVGDAVDGPVRAVRVPELNLTPPRMIREPREYGLPFGPPPPRWLREGGRGRGGGGNDGAGAPQERLPPEHTAAARYIAGFAAAGGRLEVELAVAGFKAAPALMAWLREGAPLPRRLVLHAHGGQEGGRFMGFVESLGRALAPDYVPQQLCLSGYVPSPAALEAALQPFPPLPCLVAQVHLELRAGSGADTAGGRGAGAGGGGGRGRGGRYSSSHGGGRGGRGGGRTVEQQQGAEPAAAAPKDPVPEEYAAVLRSVAKKVRPVAAPAPGPSGLRGAVVEAAGTGGVGWCAVPCRLLPGFQKALLEALGRELEVDGAAGSGGAPAGSGSDGGGGAGGCTDASGSAMWVQVAEARGGKRWVCAASSAEGLKAARRLIGSFTQ